MFLEALATALAEWPVEVCEQQRELLYRHYALVREANRTTNLTRITQPADAAVQHVADSLSLLLWVRERFRDGTRVLDVGTGAGYPAVPLAVARPDWHVTAIDSTGKKVAFLQEAALALGLANFSAVHARAEHWKTDSQFDVLTLRAVASLAEGLKKCRRLPGPGGLIVFYKAARMDESEDREARRMADKLGFALIEQVEYELRDASGALPRRLWIYERIAG